MARDCKGDGHTDEVDEQIPHLEVLRFYETTIPKVVRSGLTLWDHALFVGAVVALGGVALALRANPSVYLLGFVAPFVSSALLHHTLNDRGVALGKRLRTVDDLNRAVVGTLVTKMESFLSQRGWLSDSQISHLCEVYNSRRADHRDRRAWLGQWIATCLGFVLSALVGAMVSNSVSRGDDKAFTGAMVLVTLLLAWVTLLVYLVWNVLRLADRKSHRLEGLVEILRAIQVRLVKR